jgi:copper chaperone NosL
MSRLILLFVILFVSCSQNPESLVYGTDVCHFCKMTLVDKKFGAELVTNKGKVYKFDDVNCLLNFYNSGQEDEQGYKHKLVIDYLNPEKFVDATEAFYLKSSEIRSPMNSQVAAFSSKKDMDQYKKSWNGIYLAWGEVVTQFK